MNQHGSGETAMAIRQGAYVRDGLIFRKADGAVDIVPSAEVLVKRGGDKGWTRGTITGTDDKGRVLVDFIEDGVGKTKPVQPGAIATNIKILDENLSLMAPGRRVFVNRNGGGKSVGTITSYETSGKVRVDFYDQNTGDWAHKMISAENINNSVKPISTQPRLVLQEGETIEIFSRTDNAFNTGTITKVDETGAVHVSYKMKDGRVGTKSILAEFVDKTIRPVNQGNDIAEIFARSPSHFNSADGMFSAPRMLPNGTKARVKYIVDDRNIAIAQGKLFDNVSAAELPRGKSYTYIVKEDGRMVFGQVEDGWEVGVKHAHLANGEKVVAAGEISIDGSGAFKWNLESGSYTRKLVQSNQTTMETLERQMRTVFDKQFGNSGKYVDDVLLNSDPPNLAQIKIFCNDPNFKILNASICKTLGFQ
tara:strand:+ start:148220 stop:149482 length:1263 start_codon:yes stop_codon:yes gene_type:complete